MAYSLSREFQHMELARRERTRFNDRTNKDLASLTEVPWEDPALLHMFQCTYCTELPSPQLLFMCHRGHFLCEGCAVSALQCKYTGQDGNCSLPIERRMWDFYTRFYNACKFECKWKENGCPEIVSGVQVRLHAAGCAHRIPPVGPPKKMSKVVRMFHVLKSVDADYVDEFEESGPEATPKYKYSPKSPFDKP